MFCSKTPSVEGFVTIMRGDVVVHNFLQARDVDLAALVRADVFDVVSGDHRGRGIGAVRGVRNQHFLARVSLRVFEVGANQQQAGQFALRAGRRLQRAGVHARDFDAGNSAAVAEFSGSLARVPAAGRDARWRCRRGARRIRSRADCISWCRSRADTCPDRSRNSTWRAA